MKDTIQTKELLEWLTDQQEQAQRTLDAISACVPDMNKDLLRQAVLTAGALEHRLLLLQNAFFLVQEFAEGNS